MALELLASPAVDADITIVIQKTRLLAVLRRLSSVAEPTVESLMLMGMMVGLELARRHPATAAAVLVELEPPKMDVLLDWVVYGNQEPDPDEPVH